MPARSGDTVSVQYEGRLEDGSIFDTSAGRQPLAFVIGAGQVLPTFETSVIGLEPGGSITVTIPAEDAYGPYFDEAVQIVPVDVFGEGLPPIGGEFAVMGEDGQQYGARVTAISDDLVNVTLDFNHPLAGKALTFDITLTEILPEGTPVTGASDCSDCSDDGCGDDCGCGCG
jgi:peptidylprolyl isomerase